MAKTRNANKSTFGVTSAVTAIALAFAILTFTLTFALTGCGKSDGNQGSTESAQDSVTTADDKTDNPNGGAGTYYINIGNDNTPPADDGNGNDDGSAFTVDDDDLTRVRLTTTLDMGIDYTDRFLFVCDHTIYGLKSLSMLVDGRNTEQVVSGAGASFYVMSPSPTVYSPADDKIMALSDYLSDAQPEYILLAVGGADIARSVKPQFSEFRQSYASLIESVTDACPDSVVICMSILPGSRDSEISVYDAEQYNSRILSAASAAESQRVYYLDAASAFAASDGYLRADCDGGSSRLSTTGLMRLLEIIRTHYIAK